VKHLTLDLEQVAVEQVLDASLLTSVAHPRVVVQETMRGMAVRLEGFVATEHVTREPVVIEHDEPRSWWQHFKSQHRFRWWMRWYVRRRPVDQVHHVWVVGLEDKWVYPDAWKVLGVPVKNRRVEVAYSINGTQIGLDILAPGM
jgi:hypothetical protein